ncbi:unnamed protein product [Allacma fusca]|uniref:SH3 domain-containing protein n=1 Tax=Allacma fusca TaxID=39272 RepID=A0A8J2K875_9HEXA|nr:unnamed protein product [Allacma fusca]
MRGINESSYMSDEHGVFDSDVDGSFSGGHGGASTSGNVYTVEHLATFGLSEDLAFPADGMRRLLHMEKAGFGIWSQKMRIRLEYRSIVILDYENGNEMERFPLQLIRDPTAFTNPNPGELYNNILAFVVHPTEMHIFQCFNISATDIVEDIKMALSGRLPPQRQRHGSQNSLPPPPVNPPPEPPSYPPVIGKGVSDEVRDEDVSSVGSEGNYDREVAILNRCFDDIERFIARLQYAAAAYRELQRRRKSKKNKKKDHGEGLLSMRAKPPQEREFVDILQKFKLSFNLLARLKTHIHDPNAPELVHFLFTPLALIVDASRDAHRAGLASQVVSPLLSPGAIELLNNCLTSKETELWHSLGDAWLLSREQWKSYVHPYQPVFMDGWSPTIPESSLAGSVASEAKTTKHIEDMRVKEMQMPVDRHQRRSISPVDMMGDEFGSGQRAFMDSVRSRGGKIVVVTHHRTANNHKELTVVRGEYLEVLDDSKKWWKARNWKGQVAHVPHTIVSSPNDFPSEPGAYHGMDNGRGGNWSPPSSVASSEENFVPSRKEATPPPIPAVESKPSPSRSSTASPVIPKSHQPRPMDIMNEEMKNVLAIYRENRPKIAIQKTPEVYINQDSSVSEVHDWLKAKNFSDFTIRQLSGMNGNELFALKKSELEKICGEKEGRRLDSQITVSRNISGFKTARSSELRAILAKARAKVESDGDDLTDTHQFVLKKTTENNTRMNSVSNINQVSEIPEIKKEKPKAKPSFSRQESVPPPPPPPISSIPSRKDKGVVQSNSFVTSRYDPDTDDDDTGFEGIDDGKSTLSKMIAKRQKELLRK